jgi:hypothetical protein
MATWLTGQGSVIHLVQFIESDIPLMNGRLSIPVCNTLDSVLVIMWFQAMYSLSYLLSYESNLWNTNIRPRNLTIFRNASQK